MNKIITFLTRKLIEHTILKASYAGNHAKGIRELYAMIYKIAADRFVEDNTTTLNTFMRVQFEKSLQ